MFLNLSEGRPLFNVERAYRFVFLRSLHSGRRGSGMVLILPVPDTVTDNVTGSFVLRTFYQ